MVIFDKQRIGSVGNTFEIWPSLICLARLNQKVSQFKLIPKVVCLIGFHDGLCLFQVSHEAMKMGKGKSTC